MIRTFLYSLSILTSLSVQAQVKDTTHKPVSKPIIKDSTYTVDGGLRIGFDVSRFTLHFFQPYRTDITVQADLQLNQRLYGAIETGFNRVSHSDTNYTYKANGEYVTIGVDYDFLKKKEKGEKNMVYG